MSTITPFHFRSRCVPRDGKSGWSELNENGWTSDSGSERGLPRVGRCRPGMDCFWPYKVLYICSSPIYAQIGNSYNLASNTFNRKKGSNAGKILKEKADELEDALNATMEKYSVEMMRD